MTDILKLYGSNLKISGPFHSIPLEWFRPANPNYSPKLLKAINEECFRAKLNRKYYLATATILVIILQGVQELKNSTAFNNDHLVLFLLLALLIASDSYLRFSHQTTLQLAEMINGLIQFDSMYPKQPKKLRNMSTMEILSNVFARAMFLSQIVIPTGAAFGLHWANPWKSSLAMYWLIAKPKNCEQNIFMDTVQTGSKFLMILYNFWMWTFIITGATFTVGVLHNLSTTALVKNIEMLSKFWASSDQNILLVYKRSKVFRHIQVLTCMLNECQKGTPILIVIFVPIFVFTFSLTMLIINRNIELTFLATLWLLLIDCVLVDMVVLGQMATVYQKSAKLLNCVTWNMNHQISAKMKKWEHRFYSSCAPLKVMISGAKFVDSFTPLVCLEVSMTLTANVLMLSGAKL